MNPPDAKFDASLMFRIVKLIACPLLFGFISLGGTLTRDEFTLAYGSYDPVYGAWLFAYVFWAFYTRLESAVAGYMLSEKSKAGEVRDKFETLFAKHPFLWPAKIELFTFGLTFLVAMYLPEFGFQILWLTIGHFLFVVIWRTLTPRFQLTPIAT